MMSVIYSKIKKTICLHHTDCERKKSMKNTTKASKPCNGFEVTDDSSQTDIIINILDTNNNSLSIVEDEEEKTTYVTRTLMHRSDSVSSQPTRRVAYGAMMTRFIDAVNQMNHIVLIPSRLQDIEYINDNEVPDMLDVSPGSDMDSAFKLLNMFRNSIVYSRKMTDDCEHATEGGRLSPKLSKQLSINGKKDFLKEISLDSGYTSVVNDSLAQSLSSNSSETLDDDYSTCDMPDITLNFYHHLHGLNLVLERLIDTAKFITKKYEENLK